MTINKKEKKKRRILDALSKAELSNNRGNFERSQFAKPNKKIKRHSGRYTPQIPQKGKISLMISNAEEPMDEYDEWISYRDGFRHNSDKTHFFRKWRSCCLDEEEVYKINKKIKKQIAIRKAKKKKFNQKYIHQPIL